MGSAYGPVLRQRAAVAGLTLLMFATAHWQALRNPYVINDDVRQQIFWMESWRHAEFYPDLWLADYARRYVPVGVQTLYRLAATVMSPLRFSGYLPGFLMVAVALAVFELGRAARSSVLGWWMVLPVWLFPVFLYQSAGGLSHSFALPLLAGFLLAWVRRTPALTSCCLLLAALLSPYTFLVCQGSLIIAWALFLLGVAKMPAWGKRPWHWAAATAGCALVLGFSRQFQRAGYGPLVTAADMIGRPEFGPAGRYPMLPLPSVLWDLFVLPWDQIIPYRAVGVPSAVAMVVLILPIIALGLWHADWRPFREFAQPVVALTLSGLILYAAARIFLLRLFVPDRYIHYWLFLAYPLLIAIALYHVPLRRRPARFLTPVGLVAAALLGGVALRGTNLYDYSGDRALCEAVRQRTGAHDLVAGHPELLDNVLTFSARPVLATFELAHPWSRGAWPRMHKALTDTWDAYYAGDPETVLRISRSNDISGWIVDSRHYDPGYIQHGVFFSPYDDYVRKSAHGRDRFALRDSELFLREPLDAHRFWVPMPRSRPEAIIDAPMRNGRMEEDASSP